MKKQTLLSAAALATIAVAGGAQAATISAAKIGKVEVLGTTVTKANPYSLASELKLASTGLAFAAADNEVTLSTGTTGALGANTYKVVFNVTGAEIDASKLTNTSLTVPTIANCTTSVLLSTNNASSATFLVTAAGASCDGTDGTKGITTVKFTPELLVKASGNATISGTFSLGDNAVAGGTSKAFTLIDFKDGFESTVTAAANNPAATLASGFKALTNGGALGTVKVAVKDYAPNADTVYKDAAGNAVADTDITGVTVSVNGGSFNNLTVKVAGADAADTKVTPQVFTVAPADAKAGAAVVASVTDAKGSPINASSYTASVKATLGASFNAPAEVSNKALASITREGSTVLLPWVASGTLATTSTSNTVVRIANLDQKNATGAVSLELLTSSKGVAASTTLVPVAASIAAGGELVLTSQSLEDKLGADFGRGDIRITVEAKPEALVIRRFIQSTVNGALSEVSLGRSHLAAGSNSEPVN